MELSASTATIRPIGPVAKHAWNFLVRIDDEVGRVNDTASLFPVRADLVGVLWHFQAVADWKCCAGSFDHLFGFVERID